MVALIWLKDFLKSRQPQVELEAAALFVRTVATRVAAGFSPLQACSAGLSEDAWTLEDADTWPILIQSALVDRFGLGAESWVNRLRVALEMTDQYGVEPVQILHELAESLEREAEFVVYRQGLLAGPKVSLQVLSALPILAVLAAEFTGLRVLQFLFGSVLGWFCFLGAAVFWGLGFWWSRALVRSASQAGVTEAVLPPDLVCILVVALLGTGFSPARAVRVVGEAVGDRVLMDLADDLSGSYLVPQVSGDSRVSLRAEGEGASEFLGLRQALQWSADSGAAPESLLGQCKDAALRDSRAVVTTAAGRLGTLIVLPLGLCFLPAFILLGMVPVVFSLFSV